MTWGLLGSALLIAGLTSPAYAANRCVNAAGKITYTDEPCSTVGAKHSREVRDDGISVVPTQGGQNPRRAPESSPVPKPPAAYQPAPQQPRAFRKSPQSPVMHVCYDPSDARADVARADIESAIQSAMSLWNAGCNITFRYQGVCARDVGRADVPVDYRVYWATWDATMRIDSQGDRSFQDHFLAAASPRIGIGLNRVIASFPKYYRRAIVHEFGHVVGLGHSPNRSDVMMPGGPTQVPSGSDLDACNREVSRRHGVQ
jgi:hypothetical protein